MAYVPPTIEEITEQTAKDNASIVGVVGGSIGPSPSTSNAIARAGIRAEREACNAAGGYYANGVCHVGQDAVDKASTAASNSNAPQAIQDKGKKWLEENSGSIDGDGNWTGDKEEQAETEDDSTNEDTSAISDEDAIASVLATVPEKLKGIITKDNVIKVLEAGAKMNDPMTKIKRAMGAGVQFEWPGDWRNWKVFGPLAIPGVPLPPGIIDVTIQEVIDAVGNIGKELKDFVDDPLGTLGDLGGWVYGKVEEVFGGDANDPGWGGTLGGFEDWVKGTLGGVVGGAVLVNVYDGVKDIFDTNATTTTVIPGGSEEEEEEDILVDTVSPAETFNNLLGTVTDLTDNNVTTTEVGGSPNETFLNLLGTVTNLTDDNKTTTTQIGGFDDDDDVPVREGGKKMSVEPPRPSPPPATIEVTNYDNAPDRTGGKEIVDEPPRIVIGGGDVYVDPQDPDPIEIGGPEPTPSSSGGGGGGGGAGGTADPFLRAISYTPTVPVAIRQQAPVDFASGLMAAPAPMQASGLMSPTNSMDVLGQLIFRNLA